WVLYLLNKQTFKKIPGSNIVLSVCFALMWGIVVWMLVQDFSTKSFDVEYQAVAVEKNIEGEMTTVYEAITDARPLEAGETAVIRTLHISSNKDLQVGQEVAAHEELGKYKYLDEVVK